MSKTETIQDAESETAWNWTEGSAEGDIFAGLEEADDPKPGIAADQTVMTNAEETTAEDAQTVEESEQDNTATTATTESSTTPMNVLTDSGLVDPETGEILEPSLILRKFGWTEFPSLPSNPTREDVEDFEAKVDQVADKVLEHRDKTARWRAAADYRCAPFDRIADYWEEKFLIPLSKQLAPHKLRRFKKGKNAGEYAEKTLRLPSGAIRFTSAGGYYVHDKELVSKYIQENGVKNFKTINARVEVNYDYDKLMAHLKEGKLKDVPGTGHNTPDPFAKTKVMSPKAKGSKESEERESDD